MINMSEVANLKINKTSEEVKIVDPFCGVGGFINEIINLNPEFEKIFSANSYSNKVELKGYDKGSSDRDSERTIILAKANLLIYLSDIFSKHLEVAKIVSRKVNDIFRLHRTNLGTLGVIDEENKYDFIFTNPPYLSSGIKPIIEGIKLLEEEADKGKKFYTVHCGSLETYCLQWIIKSLKPSGKAYIILPNSVFKGSKTKEIRKFIRTNCFVEAIIKLPNKTFYTTSDKKTYILILEKKNDISEKQSSYIFTYLLSNIGEKLNSKTRENISANDCPELEILFSSFSKSKIKSSEELSFFTDYFSQEKIKQIKNNIENLKSEIWKNMSLASEEKDFWELVYEHGKGNSKLTKKYIQQNKGNYPVYSSAFKHPELGRINTYDIDSECIQLIKNADAGRIIYWSRQKMSYNGDCWMLNVREEYEEKLLLKYAYYYLKYCLQIHKKYDWNYKITKKNFLLVFKPKIKFPSLEIQRKMVDLWNQIEEKESSLNILINGLKDIKEVFVI
jgi:type I restriction enzyme M protein